MAQARGTAVSWQELMANLGDEGRGSRLSARSPVLSLSLLFMMRDGVVWSSPGEWRADDGEHLESVVVWLAARDACL